MFNDEPFTEYSFLGSKRGEQNADLCILGAPFDGTVSFRPGARFGPEAIRHESWGLETFSPYQGKDLLDVRIEDCGDLELPFGDAKSSLMRIKENYLRILKKDKKILLLGGEHLITLPAIEAVLEKYEDLVVIQLDAHADLRNDYMGNALSHATVIRRVHELVGDGRIYQWGVRSGTAEEFLFSKQGHTFMTRFDLTGFRNVLDRLSGLPIYLTLDLDVLDPAFLPGTGTPEPGGLTFNELLKEILNLSGHRLVGADVVELSPHYDLTGASTAAAAKLVRELLMLMAT